MRKAMIAGCGGINSWFVRDIYELIDTKQIPKDIEFTMFDADRVEEKNLLYQNFSILDVLKNKAEALSERYLFDPEPMFVTEPEQFNGFNIIICGVDNRDFREMLFRHVMKTNVDFWMDLRAEGTRVAAYCKHKKHTLESLLKTLPAHMEEGDSTSCQLDHDLEAGIVQLGNRIIATIGAQFLLQYLRGEIPPASYEQMF